MMTLIDLLKLAVVKLEDFKIHRASIRDNDWRFVGAVQVEGHWVDDADERTGIWIYRLPNATSSGDG